MKAPGKSSSWAISLFSTIATYVIKQSDRAVLGLFIPVDLLGIYGIAFALATMPITLVEKFSTSIVFPLYRERHPLDAPKNRAKMFRARRMSGGFSLALTCFLAFIGPWLVEALYDDRYIQAGPITVLARVSPTVPVIVLNGAMNTALSKGELAALHADERGDGLLARQGSCTWA